MLTNARLNYSYKPYQFSKRFRKIKDSYEKVGMPYFVSPASNRKILFVFDYVPTDDLKSERLLHGTTGDLLDVIDDLSKDIFLRKLKVKPFSWVACTFNAFRTVGRDKEFQEAANVEFAERINSIIVSYRPDQVVIFGDRVFKYLLPKYAKLSDNAIAPWHGVPILETAKWNKQEHRTTFFANISMNSVITGGNSGAAMIGYIARRFGHALYGSNPYAIDIQRVDNHQSVLIDTLPKFNKMLDMLAQQPVVAIDTETKNLNKVTNKLLTVQFAKCLDYGYMVPIYHKDTPFNSKELEIIRKSLRQFFEGQNDNRYHVYTNAVFDLNVLRTALRCSYMANNIWDIFAGEYGIDENHKFLESVTGDYYYSMKNLSVQYGYTGYLTAEFGKKNRGSMETVDLDTPGFLKYGTLDVVVPFAIHEKQIELAENIGHTKYKSLIMEQCSDLIHGFSKMSTTGSKLDVNYLFSLHVPGSPIEQVITKMEHDLLSTEAVQKANKIISRKQGIPEKSLFGNAENSSVFSFRKVDHKQILFFDVLKLKPISKGASGKGKLDKKFQTTYAEVPEVKMYTALEKAKKLKNAFVKSFIKLLGIDDDLKSDHRIRPNYHYLKVITGRTSASDPNLQQVPNHSELAKHIKRLFIAPEGYMYVKVDYRVHEVRGWGIISKDKGIADIFIKAKELRDEYKERPTPELKVRLKAEADVHIMNASYFFSVAIEKVDKELRNAVKGVIFGLIYQMSTQTLANNLGKTLEFTEKLVHGFTERFPNGMKWIERTKKFANKNLYYENPLGFRRHVWGLALPIEVQDAKRVHAANRRQIVNSPVQGMCAQFAAIGMRQLDKAIHKVRVEEKRKLDIQICNSVHDSVENLVAYNNLLEALFVIEDSLTTKVREEVERRHNFKFVVDVEIDTDVGSNMANCQAWDCSLAELERIVFESLCFQKRELGYKINVLDIMEDVFVRQLAEKTSPLWLRKQAKNVKYVFDRDKLAQQLKDCK